MEHLYEHTAFMKQIKKDAFFLAKLNIMDYSLLIGIHDRDKRGEINEFSVPPPTSALMGISEKSAVTAVDADATGTPRRRTSFQGTRSKVQFRKSIISTTNIVENNEASLSTEVNCM